jgi:hypothetical protein
VTNSGAEPEFFGCFSCGSWYNGKSVGGKPRDFDNFITRKRTVVAEPQRRAFEYDAVR